MALKLIANYSKRLGLPGYSSHQFSVTVEAEIVSISEVAAESSRLYHTLQKSVDEQIQSTGFIPDEGYGLQRGAHLQNGNNGSHQSNGSNGSNGNAPWKCSQKQKELILKLVDESNLDKEVIEKLSQEMFSLGVKELNKLQASGLIDRLIDEHGGKQPRQHQRSSPPRAFTGRRG